MNSHKDSIISQFSKQAIPFTKVPGHFDSISMLVKLSEAESSDRVLDVACGPGLVACEFAKHCKSVTGIDITPDMVTAARENQKKSRLTNTSWDTGEAYPLPYSDGSFSLVITRYSFHHFPHPEEALAEMIRVCSPGGRVMVADVGIAPDKSDAYDRLEKIRDPSHVHALTTDEFNTLFLSSGLKDCRRSGYDVEIELENQIQASFPEEGGKEMIRKMITEDVGINSLGVAPFMKDGDVYYKVPISVFIGRKA